MYDNAQSSTAEAIRTAAIGLFSAQGYSNTSLRQVADTTGLVVGSLYNHISSKEDLLFEIMKGSITRLREDTEAALEGVVDPVDRLRVFMRAGIRYHAENRQEALIGVSELRSLTPKRRRSMIAMRDRYQHLLEELLTDAVQAGRIEVPDIKLAAYAGVAICLHVATWYQPSGRLRLKEIEEKLSAMYAPAVAAGAVPPAGVPRSAPLGH
jgi:TetR/AcrR family transcriptional regulator, cholesterol catabolism regulator